MMIERLYVLLNRQIPYGMQQIYIRKTLMMRVSYKGLNKSYEDSVSSKTKITTHYVGNINFSDEGTVVATMMVNNIIKYKSGPPLDRMTFGTFSFDDGTSGSIVAVFPEHGMGREHNAIVVPSYDELKISLANLTREELIVYAIDLGIQDFEHIELRELISNISSKLQPNNSGSMCAEIDGPKKKLWWQFWK